jgi:hypothetical protein
MTPDNFVTGSAVGSILWATDEKRGGLVKKSIGTWIALLFLGCQASAQNPGADNTPKPIPETTTPKPGLAKTSDGASLHTPSKEELARYTWLTEEKQVRALAASIPPPEGYTRVAVSKDSFGEWLRGLPLRAPNTPVNDYNGGEVRSANDLNVAAVVELDVGVKDLQQCADSIIRLHAEWLWATKSADKAAYKFTSGDLAQWKSYAAGERAKVSGNKVSWAKTSAADNSYQNYRKYLNLVFTYAGTLSLDAFSTKIKREELAIGDFWVTGGSPGHTVLLLDIAQNEAGKKVALIGQGFLPAQDFHVLSPGEGGPWFSLEEESVETPFWKAFPWSSLRRL